VGLLTVDSRAPGRYDEESAQRAMALADHTAVAIYKARLLDHLQHANRELRELDELKGQFIQNVAHELRTPLALVRGHVELIAQGDLDATSQTAAINSALKHTRALVRLVENITTIQDLNVEELTVESVDAAELFDTAIQLANQKAIRTGILFCRDYPENLPPVAGDFNVLAHAIYQLVDNAIKFSSSGGIVTLRIMKDPRVRELEISVEDQGIGVPLDEQERIFELFYQTDGTTTRRFGGTGLGLAIVDRAIKMHGGRVWVESPIPTPDDKQNAGSRFIIRLPYGPI
jgi:signal transduction histidine kinase